MHGGNLLVSNALQYPLSGAHCYAVINVVLTGRSTLRNLSVRWPHRAPLTAMFVLWWSLTQAIRRDSASARQRCALSSRFATAKALCSWQTRFIRHGTDLGGGGGLWAYIVFTLLLHADDGPKVSWERYCLG